MFFTNLTNKIVTKAATTIPKMPFAKKPKINEEENKKVRQKRQSQVVFLMLFLLFFHIQPKEGMRKSKNL